MLVLVRQDDVTDELEKVKALRAQDLGRLYNMDAQVWQRVCLYASLGLSHCVCVCVCVYVCVCAC